MKILFYLPLARKWMLENVLEPMIAKLAPVADVHVIMSSAWIDARTANDGFRAIVSHQKVTWHPITLTESERDTFDLEGPSADLVDLVNAIAPDHCLCRSANASLPHRFPGQVRYIMEASAPPFQIPRHWISLQPQIFDHGIVPNLPSHLQEALVTMISPVWEAIESGRVQDPTWLLRHGLPDDRKIIALPLEYDHPDNLFQIHRDIRPNADLVARILDHIDGPLFLAVSDHPLNIDLVSEPKLRATISAQSDKAHLLSPLAISGDMTSALTQHADGMIVGNSKSFAAAAFYGKPLLRSSNFATGQWLQAYNDLDQFTADIAADRAKAPARWDAMVWFAHYLATQAFGPRDIDVTSAELLDRIADVQNPNLWDENMARVKQFH